jgi:ferredoxin-NADP reductase
MGLSSQNFGLAVGWLAVGWVMLQAAMMAVRTWRRRAQWEHQYHERRAEFCKQVQATARKAHAARAIPDWEGWRPFRVAAIVDETHDVKSFYLMPTDGRTLSRYAPGQYLTFRLPMCGRQAPLVRCYSLSDRPREDYFRVTVKRVPAQSERPDAPPGRGSSYLHDQIEVGNVLEVRAPAGMFFIDPLANEPIVLVGSGIGITPLLSMLNAIIETGRRRVVYVLFGFRNGRDQPFREHLQKLAQENSNIRLHVSYSAPRTADVPYRDYNHRGRLTIERVREALPSNNFRFFVCGPSGMMESLVPALWEWGVPESQVHFEAFGPATVKRVNGAGTDKANSFAVPCDVQFERTGRTRRWDGSYATLLEFGEAVGIAMPSGCRAGSCGECLTEIQEGAVRTIKQPGIPVAEGHCLTCVSAPSCDLVLNL